MPLDTLLGPLGLTAALLAAVAYAGREVTRYVRAIWTEHVRVDRERSDALIRANDRVDALRESNDANVKVMDRAVAQNERLLAAIISQSQATHTHTHDEA